MFHGNYNAATDIQSACTQSLGNKEDNKEDGGHIVWSDKSIEEGLIEIRLSWNPNMAAVTSHASGLLLI